MRKAHFRFVQETKNKKPKANFDFDIEIRRFENV